jgi:hypothetical protein
MKDVNGKEKVTLESGFLSFPHFLFARSSGLFSL